MTPEDLKRELGSTAAVATMLCVSQQTVKNWSCGRGKPTAVTTRLIHLLGKLKREAPDVFASLVGWVGTDTRSVRERLDEMGTPSYVADYLGVSRPVLDAWRSGATQRVDTVVRLLDVLDLVRALAPGVLGERPKVTPVVPGEAVKLEHENKREAALSAARVGLNVARFRKSERDIAFYEDSIRRLEAR